MSATSNSEQMSSVVAAAKQARVASRVLARLSVEVRNEVLSAEAEAVERNAARILEANAEDVRRASAVVADGKMSEALLARLRTSEKGIAEMAMRIRDVVRLPDPLGKELLATQLDQELVLSKITVPLGVVGVVFEARPEVIPQVASLALKSGNALLLKGGSEAALTNEVLIAIWREVLSRFPAVPQESIHLLQTRTEVMEMLALDREIDLIVPRGSREFVGYVSTHSRIPVLGHGEGICHVYVDRIADIGKAMAITVDSKVQYPAACNSAETLLVHEATAKEFLPQIVRKLTVAGVEVRGCARTIAFAANENVRPAKEADWSTEYSDLILSVRVVDSIEDAIEHIHRYGSRHTETIVTEDSGAASKFLDEIDAAGVFHNASTRFADGYRYGFGAELGISNSKLHARGPVGIEGLTSYKYKLTGNGQTVAEYASGEKRFLHRRIV
jgi:glutamate-5-semialdehyde dehydrogenase